MVITKDTELSELVQSEEVRNIILDVDSSIKSNIEKRNSVIKNEIKNGHLNDKYLIDSKTTYTNSANEVIKTYEKVIEDSTALVKNITIAAIDKQREELEELKKCIEEEIERLNGAIINLRNECSSNMSKISSANPEKDRTVNIHMTNTYHSQYYGGCSLPSSFPISYGSEASDKGTAKNRIDRAYNQSYDPKGAISRQKSILQKYELKKEEVIKKIKELDNKRTSYATDSTEQEYITIPGGHRIPKSANPNYKPTGIQAPHPSTKTPATTPTTTPTTEAPTETKSLNEFVAGDNQILIDGKTYKFKGYITINGENKAMFQHGWSYYYFDSDNTLKFTNADWNTFGGGVKIDGQKYAFNKVKDTETFEYSDSDKAALQSSGAVNLNNYENGYIDGDTLYYNDKEYKKVMVSNLFSSRPATVTTETGTYELYGNGYSNPYYQNDQGEIHKATHISGDTKDGFWQYQPVDDENKGEVSNSKSIYDMDTKRI